ncbi:ester cyclase [Oceanicola sp. S124]|uniref:ester cyclase n=1 Tax=Oceanicola sp. S124 TaxID=1042378 RepID=UPI0002557989|nr:ester cyclase [Oceanicola sp. S124]
MTEKPPFTASEITAAYRAYIDCLNRRDWDALPDHVAAEVHHNDRPFGLPGYRAMLESDVRAIPDLAFNIARLACEPPLIAAGLAFDCTPVGALFGLPVNGRRVQFTENVFYHYAPGPDGAPRIHRVWSVIDQAALAAQL